MGSKLIFGIFAHPDDEGFGPACTLMKEVDSGTEVHLITLTNGSAGANPDNESNLGSARLQEWKKSGNLIGASGLYFLGFDDGKLCNDQLEAAAHRVESVIHKVTENREIDEIELMSFELGGISGHIDHIVAARTACHVFYRLQNGTSLPMTKIRLFCLPESTVPVPRTDWVFMDKGYSEDEIDEKINVSDYTERFITIIETHHSQRGDGMVHLDQIKKSGRTKYDHFIVRE